MVSDGFRFRTLYHKNAEQAKRVVLFMKSVRHPLTISAPVQAEHHRHGCSDQASPEPHRASITVQTECQEDAELMQGCTRNGHAEKSRKPMLQYSQFSLAHQNQIMQVGKHCKQIASISKRTIDSPHLLHVKYPSLNHAEDDQ